MAAKKKASGAKSAATKKDKEQRPTKYNDTPPEYSVTDVPLDLQADEAEEIADESASAVPDDAAPADPVARLAFLFRGLRRAYGTYDMLARKAGGPKVTGKAFTERGEPTLRLWDAHLRGEKGLGIVPINEENCCFFGAIDVDQYSLDLNEVEERVRRLRLPLLPARTKSGGVHLYSFGREPLPADLFKRRLEEWSVALGFGGAEVFPKQERLISNADTGNWINMPYFAIHSEKGHTERYGVYKGQQLSLAEFCARAERIRITIAQLEALEPQAAAEFTEGPPCLQSMATVGFMQGVRNDSLFAIGVYLRKRYPDEWQSHIHAYNSQYLKPPLGDTEVKTIVKSLGKKTYNYACDRAPCKNYCNRNLCRTRQFGIGSDADNWDIIIDAGDAQRITSDPPYWIATVNGVRMELFSEELQSQHLFGKKCIEKIKYNPAKIPANKWRAEVNKLLQSAQDVAAPPEASIGGELLEHLRQFCTVFPQAETREEIVTGKPFTEDGHVHFRSSDFKRYLESQHFRGLAGSRLFAYLRAAGVSHKQYWVGEANINVWFVKAFDNPPIDIPARSTTEEGAM